MNLFVRQGLGRALLLLAMAAVAVLSAGCGSPSPSAVVTNFHAALLKGDMETVGKNCTPETMQMVATFGSKLQPMLKGRGKIKSMNETVTGDEAKVEVTYENGDSDTYDLVRKDGKWKIHADMKSGSGK
jgi:hypothetical protein